MNRMVFVIVLILTLSSVLVGSTTGKIAGNVVDALTKEPLVGANVLIEGTFLGGSTDADGDFYIINIPVGTYTITVSYIGYQTIIYPGVRVILDQTTKLNFELREEIAEGEAIVVTAEAFKVQKDETTKKITIQKDDIQAMPVRDFSELIAAQAGVIQMESSIQGIAGFEDRGIEEIHVRGGRVGEIGYTIDGMYIVNPFYGSKYSWTQLNDFAVEQVDIKTGVWDAEYGGAMSQMVNLVTRDGGDKLEGNLRLQSSNLANLSNLFNNQFTSTRLALLEQDFKRDYREIAGGFGGTVPFTRNRLKFLVSGHKMNTAYRVYEFDDITHQTDPEHTNPLDTLAGWRAMGFRNSWDVYSKFSLKLSQSMRFSTSFWNLSTTFRTANLANYPYQFFEEGRNITTQSSDRQAVMFNHQLSNKTFYDIRFSRFFQKMFIGVTDDGTQTGRYLRPEEYEQPSVDPDYLNNPFWFEYYVSGHDRYYHTNFAETYEGFVNVLSQVNKNHQLKFGGSYRYHTIMIDEMQLPWLLTPYVEKYTKNPEEISFYLQDLIEYDYMTIHLGIRLDMLNANSKFWKDPYAPGDQKELVDSKWETTWSPRIGFSHVITDNATFTFGYGQFTQTPTYRNKYINQERDLKTYSPLVGNSGLDMERMTAYEFGLNVGLSESIILQTIGWNKEYSQLTSTERIPQFPYSYTIFLNTDYATARGIDLVLRMRKKNQGLIFQYTYSRATANRRDPWEGYRQTDTPRTMPKRELLMSYDRTHDFSAYYTLRFGAKEGPQWLGIHPLQNISLNLMFMGVSGFPYTPVVGNVAGETNSERGPWNLTANFNLRRFINVGGVRLIAGMVVQNLFDWKNPIDIYPQTGKADDPGARINTLIEQGFYSTTLWDQPYRYGRRRQIDFTLEFAF